MKRPARFFALGLFLLASCGPDLGTLKKYVVTSQRNHLAIMPFTIADGQRDVRRICEGALHDQLSDLGYAVVEAPVADDSGSVFGPGSAPPRLDDVRAYGLRCNAGVVLVGRIERAAEGRPETEAQYRRVRRTRTVAGGRRETYDDAVVVRAGRPAGGARLDVRLKLFDTLTGHQVWASRTAVLPPEWSLTDAANFEMKRQAVDLTQTFVGKKL